MAQIEYVVLNTQSKPDVYGNTYWFSKVIRCEDGASVMFLSDHSSNVNQTIRKYVGSWENMVCEERMIPIRSFNALSKNLPYLKGCCGTELMDNITVELNKDVSRA